VVWLPLIAKVIEIPRDRLEVGYRKVRRVRITRMENVPSNIGFARKKSKIEDEFEKKKERLLETLACLISHPSMIKFWVLHPTTMEAYTLWWNGGSLKSFWTIYDSKVFEATSYEEYHLVDVGILPLELKMVMVYRKNRVKLVLFLLAIIEKYHSQNILQISCFTSHYINQKVLHQSMQLGYGQLYCWK
jgi:hypothetical protein